MAKYRKKPVVIEATQWFKNGDHPQDHPPGVEQYAISQEGLVVRYFRRPDKPGNSLCSKCSRLLQEHGWIDTLEAGHRVCPGDWIITGVKNERYPCKDEIFRWTYDPVVSDEKP